MKKNLLLIVVLFVLTSCSSQDEILKPENQILLDDKNSELMELRTASSQIPAFAPSNLVMIYEYSSSVNGKYFDFYYTKTYRGSSFYDSRSGRTYNYECQKGKICKEKIPYFGGTGLFDNYKLVYSTFTGRYGVNTQTSSTLILIEDLGFLVYQTAMEDKHNYEDGNWGSLRLYGGRGPEYENASSRLMDAVEIQKDDYWSQHWYDRGTLGVIVVGY